MCVSQKVTIRIQDVEIRVQAGFQSVLPEDFQAKAVNGGYLGPIEQMSLFKPVFVVIDIVFDSVGNDTFQSSLSSLAHCGYLINFGQSSGPVQPVLMSTLAEKSLSISRPILFHYFGNRKNYENMAASVFKAFEDEIIKVSEFLPFDLKDASNAHDTLESRKGGGSIYLVP